MYGRRFSNKGRVSVFLISCLFRATAANNSHANASVYFSAQAVAAVRNVKRFTSCMTEDDFAERNKPGVE